MVTQKNCINLSEYILSNIIFSVFTDVIYNRIQNADKTKLFDIRVTEILDEFRYY
jgi:hypothetical protein